MLLPRIVRHFLRPKSRRDTRTLEPIVAPNSARCWQSTAAAEVQTPQHIAQQEVDPAFYNYTSGRWLYNESRRLSERYLPFNVPSLARAVARAVSKNEGDVQSIRKLAEGGFNRSFEISLKDGLEVVARLPYPSTLPKRYAVASEVATLDLVRSYGIPVPRVYDYSLNSDNPVGCEYILMEKMAGTEIGHTWYNLSMQQKKSLTFKVAKLEAILFFIPLPAYGSVYYKRDLATTDRCIDIPDRDGLCIGPIAALSWWHDRRELISIDRGPFNNTDQLTEAGAKKELAWASQYGHSRFPFDRHHREYTGYQKSSLTEHCKHLNKYLQISRFLTPNTTSLVRPTLRHPDLQPHNIFVSGDSKIVGLIDWQYASVLPLFLQAGVPKYWQNPSDGPVVVEEPKLPSDFEQLNESEKAKALQEVEQRKLYLLYLGATSKFNSIHFDAHMAKGGPFRRRIFEHASAPWEGDNVTLKADLILAIQNWGGLAAVKDTDEVPACPISFPQKEAEECLRLDLLLKEADADMEEIRHGMAIGSDGWVPSEEYDGAVKKNQQIRQVVIDRAEDERDRQLSLAHYPFDDHDEDE